MTLSNPQPNLKPYNLRNGCRLWQFIAAEGEFHLLQENRPISKIAMEDRNMIET